jgi:hypothetical protein
MPWSSLGAHCLRKDLATFNILLTVWVTTIPGFTPAAETNLAPGPAMPAALADSGAREKVRADTTKGSVPEDLAQARRDYNERYLGLKEQQAIDPRTGSIESWPVPYRGKYQVPLEPGEFYRILGRQDLASSYDTQSVWKRALFFGGAGAFFVGGAVGTLAVIKTQATALPDYSSCLSLSADTRACTRQADYVAQQKNDDQRRSWEPVMIAGYSVAAAGLGAFLWSMLINPDPVSESEQLRMIDHYNAELREELGLPDEGAALEPATMKRTLTWQAAPIVITDGAGLALVMVF